MLNEVHNLSEEITWHSNFYFSLILYQSTSTNFPLHYNDRIVSQHQGFESIFYACTTFGKGSTCVVPCHQSVQNQSHSHQLSHHDFFQCWGYVHRRDITTPKQRKCPHRGQSQCSHILLGPHMVWSISLCPHTRFCENQNIFSIPNRPISGEVYQQQSHTPYVDC